MKQELKIFLTAVMFYTRIPVPKSIGFTPDNLNKSSKYLPLIGIIVGSFGAGIFMLANYFLSIHTSIIFSIISTILLTGAFHEDAISDFCDGFGGGYNKQKILDIMKDSQIGTYGGLSLVLIILLKLFLLSEVEVSKIPIVIIAAHSMSRISPIALMFCSKYIRKDETAKAKPVGQKKPYSVLLAAIIFGVIPMLLLPIAALAVTSVVLILIFIYFRYYIKKKLGGHTGDVMGALQQISEIGFYISFIFFQNILCNYI